MSHRVYSRIIEVVAIGHLAEPFGNAEFAQATPELGHGTHNAFLHKHAVGNPDGNTELFERVAPGRFRLVRPLRYGFGL
jgi:hypothetical protein